MARPASTTPTNAEREILDVLWRKTEASVREVADELSKKKDVAYTTVLTMLGILARKGLVSHRTEGRAFIYSPVISRGEARKHALQTLLTQFFNGSPDILAQHLLSEHDVDLDELKALQEKVDAMPDEGDSK
jgi:predicted transcriptional regulator